MTTRKSFDAEIVRLAEIEPARCPCGWARRAYAVGAPNSVHKVEILEDAATHYHRDHAETYYVLEAAADACVELDGAAHPVEAGMVVFIPPGVRHRAVGRMTILNIVTPPFDPADEWFD
ncbi:MAG: cupin domain-containing protein [Planctomycetia bacterium]